MNATTQQALAAALLICLTSTAPAQTPEECAPTAEAHILRFARQASLDLRGVIPTIDELSSLREATDPEVALSEAIESWVESEDFYDVVRRDHAVLFWSNLDAIQQVSHESLTLGIHPYSYLNYDHPVVAMFNETPEDAQRRKDAYRGVLVRSAGWPRAVRGNGISQSNNFCLAVEHTEFAPDGRPLPMETYDCASATFASNPALAATTDLVGTDRDGNDLGVGTCVREGFVYVEPYWAPGTQVKVCAFDAMTIAADPSGQTCDGSQKENPYCGCGPNLRHCNSGSYQSNYGADSFFRDALAQEPSRIVESVIREGRPYHEAFSQQHTVVNGALAHYYRYIASGDPNAFRYDARFITGDPAVVASDIPFETTSWDRMEREEPHAGALTTPGYLLRIASHRGRANRFFTAFYCDPFVSSADGVPAEEAEPDPNLRERPGCAGCHNTLEPAATHWTRWFINGTYGYLGPDIYSVSEPTSWCGTCGVTNSCSTFCNTYFVTPENSDESTFEAYPRLPLQSIYLSPTEQRAIDTGPAGLVDDDEHEQYQVGACAVRRVAESLFGRALVPSESEWLEQQTHDFEETNWNYREMIERLVQDSKYRAVR